MEESEINRVVEPKIVFLDSDSMKHNLEKLRDIPNTRIYLFPLLLKFAGRELYVSEVLLSVMAAIGAACSEENKSELFPLDSRRIYIEQKAPRIVQAMMCENKELLARFRSFHKFMCDKDRSLFLSVSKNWSKKVKI